MKIIKSNSKPGEKLTTEDLHAIRAKTVIILGEDDEIIPLRYGELLNDAIPGKCFRVLREVRSLCRFM